MKWPGAQMLLIARLYELWNEEIVLLFLALCYKW